MNTRDIEAREKAATPELVLSCDGLWVWEMDGEDIKDVVGKFSHKKDTPLELGNIALMVAVIDHVEEARDSVRDVLSGEGKGKHCCLRIIVEPDGDEFHAFCPELKGLHVAGDTAEEALMNAADGASAYLESVIKHGDALPALAAMKGK